MQKIVAEDGKMASSEPVLDFLALSKQRILPFLSCLKDHWLLTVLIRPNLCKANLLLRMVLLAHVLSFHATPCLVLGLGGIDIKELIWLNYISPTV